MPLLLGVFVLPSLLFSEGNKWLMVQYHPSPQMLEAQNADKHLSIAFRLLLFFFFEMTHTALNTNNQCLVFM